MNRTIFDKKIRFGRLHMASRRVTALVLAAVICAGLYTPVKAADTSIWPLQAVTNVADPGVVPAVPDGSGEAPTITIETNGVIDQGRQLTGFLEVAIRVKPGVLHLAADGTIVNSILDSNYDHSETQPFSSLAVALEYSDKLTPWEWEKVDGDWNRLDEAQPGNQPGAITATSAIGAGFSAKKMVEIDPIHKSTRIAHAAISPKSTVGGDGVTSTISGGYLYLMAEGFTAKDFNNEDTVLAVVRFKYDIDQTDDNNNPWGTMFAKGLNNPNVTDWIDPNSPNCLVKLTDAVTLQTPIDPIEDWEVIYNSGKSVARPQGNRFYYSTDTTAANGMEAYDPTKPTTDPNFASTTSNAMDVATVDTMPSTTTVVPGKVNYTLVNKLSYNFSRGDSAVILYYDWDDRHIGTQVLSPGDAREAVNQYVEETFIHPDLRYSVHKTDANASDYTDSLLRENTYRGEYPYDVPVAIPDVTSPTYDADLAAYQAAIAGRVAADGADYPLTNKLDYVFFKRHTAVGQTITDPDGIPDNGDEITAPAKTLIDPDDTPNSGDEYYHIDSYDAKLLGSLTAADVDEPSLLELPYIYGWAVVDDLDGITDVWTTLGTGEHTPYTGMDAGNGNAPIDTTIDTTYGTTGECLQFADFSNLEKGQVVRVKAVYEPGPNLQSGGLYSIVEPARYERYGSDDTFYGGVYSIAFSYARVNTDGAGVSRMREPSVRIDYTPDVKGEAQKPFSAGIDLENRDILPVTYTPSSALMSMEYSLRDKKLYNASRFAVPTMIGYNFYTGAERSSHGNLNNIMESFKYDEHPYSQHLGSMGFVTVATLNQIDKLCREAVQTGSTVDVELYVTLGTINDVNWKGTMDAVEYEEWELPSVIAKLLDAYRIAGDAPLDWHQIQYHLINSTYDWGTSTVSGGLTNNNGVISPAVGTLAYNWCRIDNCSGGSEPIKTWADLMKAAADYVYTPNANAFNQLQDMFELRQGITAQPFADKDAMKAALLFVIGDPTDATKGLRGQGFTQTDIEKLTWKQVQYLLDLVDSGTGIAGITPTNLPADDDIGPAGTVKKDYWWQNNGTKTITTWEELLEIQYHILHDGYFAGDGATSGWRDGYTSPTTALTGSVRDKDASGNWKPTTDPSPFTTKSVSLRKDAAGGAFANISTFDDALRDAIGTLCGQPAYANGSFTGVSLMEIQHALLRLPYKSESELMDDTVAGNINYWWITGASTPKNLKELVVLVKQVVDGAPTDLLDNVTVELVSKGPFWLRGSSTGAPHSDNTTLRDDLILAVDDWCSAGNDPATAPWPDTTDTNWSNAATRQVWSQLQYLLLGNIYAPNPDPGPSYDYWWYGNGSKPINDLASLLEAAWNSWGGPGGSAPSGSTDPNAMDALTEANLGFITGTPVSEGGDPKDYVYFRQNTNGDAFGSMEDFKTAMKTAIAKLTARNDTLDYTKGQDWIVIQHLLLGNSYRPATNAAHTGLRDDSSIDYWWENGQSKAEESDVSYAEADAMIASYMSDATYLWDDNLGNITTGDVNFSISADDAVTLNLQDGSGNVLTASQITAYIVEAANEFGTEVWDNGGTSAWNAYLESPELKLDWKSFQYWILHKDEANIGDKQLALKDKTYSQISTAPYNIPWTPAQPAPANYTKADAMIASYMSDATYLWDDNLGNITTGDVNFSISADDAVTLNLQDGSGNVLTASQITAYIVEAANEFGTEVWDNGGTSAWNAYLESPELKLDWKSFQYWILHKDAADIGDKQLALKDKTEAEIAAAPYNITWAPVPPPPVNYTWADGKIADYMSDATYTWDDNLANITTGDVSFTITAAEAAALNLQDGSGNVLTESQITAYIVEAANEFGTEVWDNGSTSAWNVYLESPELKLDWKSFQYWILHKDAANIGDKQLALKDKTEAEIGGDPYNITWGPANAQPALLSSRLSIRARVLKPEKVSETTNVDTCADGSRTITTTIKTTVDPNTGLTTVEETRTEERRYTDGSLESVTDTTTIVKDTATGEAVSRKVQLGTPVITDAAGNVVSGEAVKPATPGEGENKPATPTDPAEGENKPATPTDPAEGDDKPATPTDPAEGDDKPVTPTDPAEGDDKPVTPADPAEGDDKPVTPADPAEGDDKPVTPTDPAEEDNEPVTPVAPEEEPASPGEGDGKLETPVEPEADDGKIDTPAEPEKVLTEPEGGSGETEPDDASTASPLALARWRVWNQRPQGYGAPPIAGRLYAGPPGSDLRPPTAVIIGILNHNIFTTGRTLK